MTIREKMHTLEVGMFCILKEIEDLYTEASYFERSVDTDEVDKLRIKLNAFLDETLAIVVDER